MLMAKLDAAAEGWRLVSSRILVTTNSDWVIENNPVRCPEGDTVAELP